MILNSDWYHFGIIMTRLVAGIYRTVAAVYGLLLSFIEELNKSGIIEKISTGISESVYVLIAVFMLFRITISLLEYLIDPDKVSDKSVGAGKLITKIIVSLILVLAAPTLFSFAKEFEGALLDGDSILNNLFADLTGSTSDSSDSDSDTSSAGKDCDISGKIGEINTIEQLKTEVNNCILTSSLESQIKKVLSNIDGEDIKLCDTKNFDGPTSDYSKYINNPNYAIFDIKKRDWADVLLYARCDYIINMLPTGGTNYEDVQENVEGGDFARSIVGAFSSDRAAIVDKTYSTADGQKKFLEHSDADIAVGRMVEQDEIQLDAFICLLCGVGVIFIIVILCIEVVIRQLKLITLEVLSPVAFISYMNPNDKVLGNWFQKYIGCYLDLFLKLLAIKLGTFLIAIVAKSEIEFNAIASVLFYIGVFLFIKTIPNLISDIFGIKNMGGTFKESMNALKTTAGIGVGAVAGAGAGLLGSGMAMYNVKKAGGGWGRAIGAGALGLGSAATGTVKGIVSGARGKVGGGAASTWKKNSARNSAYSKGSDAWSVLGAETLGKVNLDYAQRKDREIEKLEIQNKNIDSTYKTTKDSLESLADSNSAVKAAKAKASRGSLADQQRYEAMQEAVIKYNLGDYGAVGSSAAISGLQSDLASYGFLTSNELAQLTNGKKASAFQTEFQKGLIAEKSHGFKYTSTKAGYDGFKERTIDALNDKNANQIKQAQIRNARYDKSNSANESIIGKH